MSEPLVFLNGEFKPASAAALPIYDAGIVLGATVSEFTRTFHLRPYRLDDHLDRLFRSLAAVGFEIDLTREDVATISQRLIETNGQQLEQGQELGLIQFVTAGEYPTYAGRKGQTVRRGPTVCVHTFPLPFAQWAERMRNGVRLVTPTVRNVPPECYSPAIKQRSRLHYYLADQEARRADPGALALLLDLAGNICEASTANFLIVSRGAILSPRMTNALPGVSRQTIIDLAAELGIPFVERDLNIADALAADEALLTSTPYCLMPVQSINGQPLAVAGPGPVFERLLTAWSKRVGLDIRAQILAAA